MLLPLPGPATVADAYSGAHRTRRTDRPWVVLTMITSVDGAIEVDGVSAGLGGPGDREVFLHMHRSADCVLVGAETVRRDVYSPLPAHQSLYVMSRTGDLGPGSARLTAAPNTHVVRGEVDDVVRSLPGSVCSLEGGPTLNAQMLAADLVDEACITVSPRFVGGTSARMAAGNLADTNAWKLAHVLEDDGFLFLRYLRDRG